MIDINELREDKRPQSSTIVHALLDRLEAAEKERDALRVELETERARLAACGVVALANTPDSAKRARDMRPEYWSASCGDVASLVDENIKLRAKIEAAEKSDAESIAMYRKARDERDALRANIEEMERQEPVAFALYCGWARKAVYLSEIEACELGVQRRQLTADLGGSLEAYRVAPHYPACAEPASPSAGKG